MKNRAEVRVPGSTSNIGPGYDCLGIALAIYNRIVVKRSDVAGAAHPMVAEAAEHFFRRAGTEAFLFDWSIEGEVPISRGLGSSVTLRLGILHGLNELSGLPLSAEELFQLCTEIEGHPDNAGPAVFGGFVLTNEKGDYFRFAVDDALKFVLLVPDVEVLTDAAREVLPTNVSHKEAVQNMSNACNITAAFATQDYAKLRGTLVDHLHQTYRQHLVPGLFDVIAAGTEAGALGGFLSGSGSTIACLVSTGDVNAVSEAMQGAYTYGEARPMIVGADADGALTVDAS